MLDAVPEAKVVRNPHVSDSLSVVFWRPWLLVFHPVTPDTIYCSDANLHLFGNDFGADVVGFCPDYVLDLGRSQL